MRRSHVAYRRLHHMMALERYHYVLVLFLGGLIVCGSLWSYLHGLNEFNMLLSTTRAFDYEAFRLMQHAAPTMFADRRNWMNVHFVKRAWFWNTLCIVVIAFTLKRTGGGVQGERGVVPVPARMSSWHDVVASKTFWRWLLTTIGWVALTQWMMGASVFERLQSASGATCLVNSVSVDDSLCRLRTPLRPETHPDVFSQLPPTLQARDKPLWAHWYGGVDVSGHTFVLVLSVLVLAEMIVPYVPVPTSLVPAHLRVSRRVFSAGPPRTRAANVAAFLFTLVLLCLWLGMLVATSVYYHTAAEKLCGYVFAVLVWLWMPKEMALV